MSEFFTFFIKTTATAKTKAKQQALLLLYKNSHDITFLSFYKKIARTRSFLIYENNRVSRINSFFVRSTKKNLSVTGPGHAHQKFARSFHLEEQDLSNTLHHDMICSIWQFQIVVPK